MTSHSVIVAVIRFDCFVWIVAASKFQIFSLSVHSAQHDLFISSMWCVLFSSFFLSCRLFSVTLSFESFVRSFIWRYVKRIESNQKFHFDVWSLPFIDSFRLIWSTICIILSFILINVICSILVPSFAFSLLSRCLQSYKCAHAHNRSWAFYFSVPLFFLSSCFIQLFTKISWNFVCENINSMFFLFLVRCSFFCSPLSFVSMNGYT